MRRRLDATPERYALGALLLACIACDDGPKQPPPISHPALGSEQRPAPSVDGSVSLRTAAAPAVSALVPSDAPACRVMSASQVQEAGKPVTAGALLDGEAWLDLEAGGELRVRHTRSARELGISGPARVRPCPEGLEGAWLERGTLTAAAGAGARPGAMVWVSTPHGLVEWGEAQLTVEVTPSHTQATLRSGAIAVSAAVGSTLAAPRGATKSRLSGRGTSKLQGAPNLEALTAACEEAAAAAEEAAQALLSVPGSSPSAPPVVSPKAPAPSAAPSSAAPAPSAAPSSAAPAPSAPLERRSLGGLARAHAEARSAAREACASAGAALAGAENPIAARLTKADARWRLLPRRAPGDAAKGAEAAE
ncbi:MAG: hypothetical protein KIT72_00940 [Polyangiaceae bacterium]|nr:hypothetical protein [Polyangiaceae bacterium]MCW5788962.1 hypothetical protein [Polyangiaceae bacterium]